MNTSPIELNAITPAVLRLAGRAAEDPELRAFLESCGAWPLKPFPDDEFHVGFTDKSRGFELQFEDAALVKHVAAAGKPARTPLFVGAYFFNEGNNDSRRFVGDLPYGVTWRETADQLVARLGPPRAIFTSRKTGLVTGHRWAVDGLLMTVGYRNGTIEDVYVGIT